MYKSDAHAALAYSARHAFDRIVTHVTCAKDALQTGFEQEWRALMRPGTQVATRANKTVVVALQLGWKPVGFRMRADHYEKRVGLPPNRTLAFRSGVDRLKAIISVCRNDLRARSDANITALSYLLNQIVRHRALNR
jgi:hypothetical protein